MNGVMKPMDEKLCRFCDSPLTPEDLAEPQAIKLDCCVNCTDLDEAVAHLGGFYVLPQSIKEINIRKWYKQMRKLGKSDQKIAQMLEDIKREIEYAQMNKEENDRLFREAMEQDRIARKNMDAGTDH
jgi:hypothetical protein